MELVFLGLDLGEFGKAVVEGGLELGILGLEVREVGGEREVFLLEERAGLLGGNGGRISLSPHGVELLLEVADEGVGSVRHRNGVVSERRELLIRHEKRHRFGCVTLPGSVEMKRERETGEGEGEGEKGRI